jgi:ribosomal protein L6P/L9E
MTDDDISTERRMQEELGWTVGVHGRGGFGGCEKAQLLTWCPSTVKVSIKSRLVTVEGPRGKLTKDLSHIAVNFSVLKKNVIGIEIHHGSRKNVAALRTVRTILNNLIIGVTKGFKYKMRYVYAHFPINVNVEKNAESGNYEVEIRYVPTDENPAGWG